MLAQPEGHAFYDRLSWEAPLSAADRRAGGRRSDGDARSACFRIPTLADRAAGIDASAAGERDPGRRSTWPTWARELFSKHLVAVEVAGTLLLVALVGAVAIVGADSTDARRERGPTRMNEAGPAAKLLDRRGAAVRHRPGRLLQPAEHDRDVPLGRDDAARRFGQPGGLGPFSQRLGRPDARDFHPDRRGLRSGDRPGRRADACSTSSGSLDIAVWQQLREENQPPYVDHEVPPTSATSPSRIGPS